MENYLDSLKTTSEPILEKSRPILEMLNPLRSPTYTQASTSFPSFKCSAHSNPARAICAHPNCKSKYLCSWDIRTHPHSKDIFFFSELSDDSFLIDLLSFKGQSLQEKTNQVHLRVHKEKERLQQMMERFEILVTEKVSSKLGEISMVRQLSKLQELQERWRVQNDQKSLNSFISSLKEFLNLEKETKESELDSIQKFFDLISCKITEFSDKISRCVEHLIEGFDEPGIEQKEAKNKKELNQNNFSTNIISKVKDLCIESNFLKDILQKEDRIEKNTEKNSNIETLSRLEIEKNQLKLNIELEEEVFKQKIQKQNYKTPIKIKNEITDRCHLKYQKRLSLSETINSKKIQNSKNEKILSESKISKSYSKRYVFLNKKFTK